MDKKRALNRINYSSGQQVGHCLFVEDADSIKRGTEFKRAAIFKCQCGSLFTSIVNDVKTGDTTSCGCGIIRNNKRAIPEIYINGKIRSEYYSWCAMRRRCYDKKSSDYKNYGGRGIIVCARWNESFLSFLADMGEKPSTNHTLDRIENDQNYGPTNCRWATRKEQNRNQRKTRMIEFEGETLCLAAWAERFEVRSSLLFKRIKALGIQRAFEKSFNKKPPDFGQEAVIS